MTQPTPLQRRTRERNWEIRRLRGTCLAMCNLLLSYDKNVEANKLYGLVLDITRNIKAQQLEDSKLHRKPRHEKTSTTQA